MLGWVTVLCHCGRIQHSAVVYLRKDTTFSCCLNFFLEDGSKFQFWEKYIIFHNMSRIGILRIISERTLEIDEELSVCFIDWQKAFDRVNWTKLMQILKETGIYWRERRLISNLYMAQSVQCD